MFNETYRRAVVLTVKFGIEVDNALRIVRLVARLRKQFGVDDD